VKHKIYHHSASSLNLFEKSPWLYSLKYLGKYRTPPAPKPARGTAVEHGLTELLAGRNMVEAVGVAYDQYDSEIGPMVDPMGEQRRLIEPMLERAWKIYERAPVPLAVQLHITHQMEGVDLPLDGYIDYVFPHPMGIDDLKTTEAIPRRGPRWDNVRQVALYSVHQGKPARLVYVSAKDSLVYDIGETEIQRAYAELRNIALSCQFFLSRMDNVAEALKMFAPSRDACYTDEEFVDAYEAHQKLKSV
jgi:hypothetical protein